MRKTTITCDKCGKEIKHSGEHYSPPEYVSVVVTTHSNGAVPAVLGWSNTDNYEFCFDCHQRDEIRSCLLDLVKVPRKNGGTHWVKREDLPIPPESAFRKQMSDEL
jgi:hypothetical protein